MIKKNWWLYRNQESPFSLVTLELRPVFSCLITAFQLVVIIGHPGCEGVTIIFFSCDTSTEACFQLLNNCFSANSDD